MQTLELTIAKLYNIFMEYSELINPFGATIQCIHESSSNGKPFGSGLAVQGNNLTGMKLGSWNGKVIEKKTWEQKPNGEKYQITAKFRHYDSVEDFVQSYSKMVNNSYPLCSKDNFIGYFSGFSKGKVGAWATDINYFKKLLSIALRESHNFFDDIQTKWMAVVVNASDRNLFVLQEHEKIAIEFVQKMVMTK